ncbi:hypothetical protein CC86DRAFT_380756 [Ophiobolus disseminans]|uniref:Uncharacterized protein n=1 Tax=Ophiobolus disseminans TaxID=1469910 RepID=A0A6A7A888_9PLEO|nr:hypothetical protein CC86DRAFT_380756 [Ophiobolus disseminans]
MKNIITVVLGCLVLQAWTLPVENRAVAVGPIIEEAGEGYESKRAVAVGPIIEEAGEGYESKRAVAVGPIIEEAGEGYENLETGRMLICSSTKSVVRRESRAFGWG